MARPLSWAVFLSFHAELWVAGLPRSAGFRAAGFRFPLLRGSGLEGHGLQLSAAAGFGVSASGF